MKRLGAHGRHDRRETKGGQSVAAGTIPQPHTLPLLGNLFDMSAEAPLQGMMELAREYGPIFGLDVPGRHLTVVSRADLVNELCDERRFDKLVWAPLRNVRAFAGDGLFTAWTQEPNWKKGHNILLPNFSAQAMRGYLPAMVDIAEQLARKWERLNPDDEIDVPADMTRLTLDTIGLCGFNYRFNSFYRDEPHPFIVSMTRALGESLNKLSRLPAQNKLMFLTRRQFQDDISQMNALVDQLIRERKAAGPQGEKKDLLGYMLAGRDRETGEGLDDLNIRHQIITFLIAGHETTSGLLSFAVYFLLKHPDILAKAYDEVDRVLGPDPSVTPTFAQVGKLAYITQILKETLRLWPTAPAFALSPYAATTIGGEYAMDARSEIITLIPMLHRDPAVWEHPETFDPERFTPEREAALPPNCYKPFGNGQRACIGRQFAMQEAALTLGMLLQRFELIDHMNYQLQIKETLTLKPDHFDIRVRPRANRAAGAVAVAERPAPAAHSAPQPAARPSATPRHHTPLLVLYGSNLGASEGLAGQIAEDGAARGFATTVAPLDDYAGKLPVTGGLVIVSASYNGAPPDNAAKFVAWLDDPALDAAALRGVRYVVFGVGDRDWSATYQAVPKALDAGLEAHGATRIYSRGEGDARDDFDGQFREWYQTFWPAVAGALGVSAGPEEPEARGHKYEVELAPQIAESPFATDYGARPARVTASRELLSGDAGRSTRHIEVALPEGMSYRAGDHLGALPRNSDALVARALARFGFNEDAWIRIRGNTAARATLPLDQPVAVKALLRGYVELQDPVTRAQLETLAEYAEHADERAWLLALAAGYREEVLARRLSLLDTLEQAPSVALPFNLFLEMVQPLRPRYYSISSTPLEDGRTASLTVAVVDGPARSGRGEYHGVASNYLAEQAPGATVEVFVHQPNTNFYLPGDPATPIILVGAGTGLAPYRGFLRERAMRQMADGAACGPALLFFGFRSPDQDYLYEAELGDLAARGLVTVHTACSRAAGQPKRYVQDAIREQGDAVWAALEAGAVVYVCGDASRMAPGVRAAFADVYRAKTGGDEASAGAWLTELTAAGRYRADVWPAG